MTLQGKVALVVGGSEAVGRAIAVRLAEAGASTVVCSRPGPQEPEVVAQLRQRQLDAVWMPGDMNSVERMTAVVDDIVARYGRLDILVVSGAPTGGRTELFEKLSPGEYERTVNATFISRLNCLNAALTPMAANGYGKVVFVTTDAGRTPTPSMAVSGACAAALIFFTRAAAKELARRGIRVNCIPISLVAGTAWSEKVKELDPDSPSFKAYAKIEARSPFGLTTPGDVAETVLFLASPQSDRISGATLSINGGLSFP